MTIKQIDYLLEEGQSLKAITQAYSEIANLKIKKIRASVERNRLFFAEIAAIYATIKKFAMLQKINLIKPKKTISLILTSNHGFYGSINTDVIKFFFASSHNLATDQIVVNKAGIDYFKAQGNQDYTPVLLKEDMPAPAELTTLVNLIKDYNQVLVFYPTMQSLLVQKPTVLDLTASSSSLLGNPSTRVNEQTSTRANEHSSKRAPEDFRFIFEPELPKILSFFDNQITTLLLEQAFLESELSRTGSRFIAMDEAENQANKAISQYRTLLAYSKRNLENNKIIENFASLMAIRRENNEA